MAKVTLFGISLWFSNEKCELWSQEFIEKPGSYELEKGNYKSHNAFSYQRRITKASANLIPIAAFANTRKELLAEISVLEEKIATLHRKMYCLDRAQADYVTGELQIMKVEEHV